MAGRIAVPIWCRIGAHRGGGVMSAHVSVRELGFGTREHHDALRLSIDVNAGERVAVLGPNGSAKPPSSYISMASWQLNLAGRLVIPLLSNRIWWKFAAGLAQYSKRNDQLFVSSVREDVAFSPANLGVSGAELVSL